MKMVGTESKEMDGKIQLVCEDGREALMKGSCREDITVQ